MEDTSPGFIPVQLCKRFVTRIFVPLLVPISKEGFLSIEKVKAVISWLIDLKEIVLMAQENYVSDTRRALQ